MNRTGMRKALAVAALTTLGLAACSSDDAKKSDATTAPTEAPSGTEAPAGTDAPSGTEAPSGGEATVSIENFSFSIPSGVTAGSEVKVTNNDGFGHTFTDKGGAFKVQVGGGESGTFTAPAAGTYSVYCEIHPSMTGELTVA